MITKPFTYYPFQVLFFSVYFALIGIFLQHSGYYHPQALFFSEKASLVYGHQGNLLNVLGLTYPAVPFYFTLFFRLFNPLWAPIFGTSLVMGLWIADLLKILFKSGAGKVPLMCCCLLFLLNPGFIYMAVSGSTGAYVLLFFYLMIKHLFLYFRYNTTYYLSMVGIFFVFLVFTNYHYLWFCLFLMPLLLFIALKSLNLKREHTTQQIQLVFNNVSLRRKILRRTYAIFIIIFLLPVTGFLFFLLLNRLHIGQVWFFVQSPYSSYNSGILGGQFFHGGQWMDIFQNGYFIILISMFILSPLFGIVLMQNGGRTNLVLTLFSVMALVEFMAVKYSPISIGFPQYSLIILASLVAWCNIQVSTNQIKKWQILLGCCALFSLITGILYFLNGPLRQEADFTNAFTLAINDKKESDFLQDQNMVNYLRDETAKKDLVLTDDAVSFQIVAMYGQTRKFLLPDESLFGSALENPQSYAKYILISNPNKPGGAYDVVDIRYPWLYANGWNHTEPVYSTANFRLFKLN